MRDEPGKVENVTMMIRGPVEQCTNPVRMKEELDGLTVREYLLSQCTPGLKDNALMFQDERKT